MLLYILHKKKGIRNEVYVESYDSECLSFNAIYISEKKNWCDPKLEANLHNLEFKNPTEQRNLACITLDMFSKYCFTYTNTNESTFPEKKLQDNV